MIYYTQIHNEKVGLNTFRRLGGTVHAFVNIDEARLFLAEYKRAAMWADATDPEAEEMIVDLIVNSVWTPYAVMALCEAEGILYGMFNMRSFIED